MHVSRFSYGVIPLGHVTADHSPEVPILVGCRFGFRPKWFGLFASMATEQSGCCQHVLFGTFPSQHSHKHVTTQVLKRFVPNSISPSSRSVAPREFHKINVIVCFFRPGVLGVMTAAHDQDFVKTPAVGHDCPLSSQQHSCFLIANTQLTCIQPGVSQLVSTSRLKHLHFKQLPRLTSSRPLPHKETSCVQQLRGQFQCCSNQQSSFVQLLIGFCHWHHCLPIATDTTAHK